MFTAFGVINSNEMVLSIITLSENYLSSPIGNGSEMNTCILSVPADIIDETRIYVEEGHEKVDFGYDLRDLYFKNDTRYNVSAK